MRSLAAALAGLIALGVFASPTPVPDAPAPTVSYKWVLRITYVDDIWQYPAPDRCEIGRGAVESNPPVATDMRRIVECVREAK